MSRPVVRIEKLEFRYGEGDFRLRIAELELGRASSVAFIGPSGSGKTTLLTVTHDHDLLDRFERVVDFRELLS